MKFERIFTLSPMDEGILERRDAIIYGKGGITFEQKCVEVPKFWSDNALSIVASKYFKAGETSVKEIVKRVVDTIIMWGIRENYFDRESSEIFRDELSFIFINQYASPNSPVWFNLGVPGRSQVGSACFLLDVEDNMDSIRRWYALESKIFQAGSGAGVNVSKLRPANSPLSQGGTASGPISFMKAADSQAGIIKSGGKTRRAAKAILMNDDHPDLLDFIKCKYEEEEKARILVEAGYSDGIDGEAINTVSHQNANYSVVVTDQFMSNAAKDGTKESTILDKIAEAAWKCGDPGLLYRDTILKSYMIPACGEPVSVNPCFEIVSQPPFTACNLASINVLKFWDGGTFNWRLYRHVINIMTVALDIICYCADYPDEEIAKNTREQHHIGLGYTNIGSLLMSMGLAYDSYMGRKVVASLSSSLTGQAFLTSTYMSEELGSFIGYESNKNRIEEVLTSFMLKTKELGENWLDQLWLDLLNRTRKYGLRNANVTAIAPTGTISFMMDASTTGIEPELALIKYKTLVGGGTLTLVNPVVEAALRRLNYDQSSIDSIKQYITANNTVVGSDIKKEHESVFATSFGSNSLEPMAHVRMVAEAQKFITEGISKTCNLPKEATVQDVKKVYIEAWKLGTKAVAIYRDGSKSSQPLNIRKVTTKETKSMRQSLPDERQSITHKVDIGGLELYLHVGLDENGDPKELFIQGSKQGSSLQGLLDSFATSISYCLQYGVPLEILIEKFSNTRFEPSGFTQHSDIKVATSPVDYIFRWLKWKFVDKKGNSPSKVEISQLSGDVCKQCGGMLIRTGTCFTCSNCATPSGGCG